MWYRAVRRVYGACRRTPDAFVRVRFCAGDVNHDLVVDLSDLAGLLASFGLCAGTGGYNALADGDDSGCVDLTDLTKLLSKFGVVCS